MMMAAVGQSEAESRAPSRAPRWRVWAIWIAIALPVLAVVLAVVGFFWLRADLLDRMEPPAASAAQVPLATFAEDPPRSGAPPRLARTLGPLDAQALLNPPSDVRPWARWWWPGADVRPTAACKQLRALKAQGFAGVEIQPFTADLATVENEDWRDRIRDTGSADYHRTLRKVLACADGAGLQIDLTHLSGWPAGGPQVAASEGLKELAFSELQVVGGQQLDVPVPLPSPGFNDYVLAFAERDFGEDLSNFLPQLAQLKAVVAAPVIEGKRAFNILDVTDTIVLDPAKVIDLTDEVRDGQLAWTAPDDGEWQIVFVFVMPSGEAPTLTATHTSGYVIDHADAPLLRAHYDYAFGSRTGLPPFYGKALRGIFNDSLEFKVDRLAASDILPEFAKRRGYSLTPFLPAVFQDFQDNYFIREVGRRSAAPAFELTDEDERIRYDYALTMSDLLRERFVEASSEWAHARGLLSRGQSYGTDVDTIRALGANDIPETEQLYGGGSRLFLKLAGAAGLLYDRPIVSAESFVWAERAYAITPAQIKAAADTAYLAGVNALVWHGIPYEYTQGRGGERLSREFGPAGWYPFTLEEGGFIFSGNYGRGSSIWSAEPDLTGYMARVQNLLQAGRAQADVVVYYPFLGFPLEIEDSPEARKDFLFAGAMTPEDLFDPSEPLSLPFATFPDKTTDPRLVWIEQVLPMLHALDEAGITWTWANDDALQSVGDLAAGTAVLIADAPYMQPQTARALGTAAADGRKIIVYGQPPTRQPGFRDFARNDRIVASTMRTVAQGRTAASPNDLIERLAPAVSVSSNGKVRRVARGLGQGRTAHFLVNQSTAPQAAKLRIRGAANERLTLFDPLGGKIWSVVADAKGVVPIRLGRLESLFVLRGAAPLADASPCVASEQGWTARKLARWQVRAGEASMQVAGTLEDLRKSKAFAATAGPVRYRTTIALPAGAVGRCAMLDLTRIEGSAKVSVNGETVSRSVLPPFRVDLTGQLRRGSNTIEIVLVPPLRNAMAAKQEADGLVDDAAVLSAPAGIIGEPRLLLGQPDRPARASNN
ncbi:glycosyl hydrolase [Citromicrobium bathyomarinum]